MRDSGISAVLGMCVARRQERRTGSHWAMCSLLFPCIHNSIPSPHSPRPHVNRDSPRDDTPGSEFFERRIRQRRLTGTGNSLLPLRTFVVVCVPNNDFTPLPSAFLMIAVALWGNSVLQARRTGLRASYQILDDFRFRQFGSSNEMHPSDYSLAAVIGLR